MSNTPNPATGQGDPTVYRIRIKGHLGARWADWFDGLTITPEDNGDALLTGPVVDQAALHGVLRKIRDLGLPLLSVVPDTPDHAEALAATDLVKPCLLERNSASDTHTGLRAPNNTAEQR